MSQQSALAAKRVHCILGCTKQNISSRSKEVIPSLYLALVWPQFEYCTQFQAPQYKKDVRIFECIQEEDNESCKRTKRDVL